MAVYYLNGQGYSTMGTPPSGSTSSQQATWNPYPNTNALSKTTPNTVSGYTPYTSASPTNNNAATLASLNSQLAAAQQRLSSLLASQSGYSSSPASRGSSTTSSYGSSTPVSSGYSYSSSPAVVAPQTRMSSNLPTFATTPTTGLTSVVTPTEEKNKSQLITEQSLTGTKKSASWLQNLLSAMNPANLYTNTDTNYQLAGLGFIKNGMGTTSPQGSVQNTITTGHTSPSEAANITPTPSLWQTIQNKIGASADALGKARSIESMSAPASVSNNVASTQGLSAGSIASPTGSSEGLSTGESGNPSGNNVSEPLSNSTSNPFVNNTNEVVNGLFNSLNNFLAKQSALNASAELTPEQKLQQLNDAATEINPQVAQLQKQTDDMDLAINNAMIGVRQAAEAIRNNPDLSVYQQQARLQQLDDINNYQPIYNGLSLKDLISYRGMLNDRLTAATAKMDKDTQILLGLSDFQTSSQRTKDALGVSSDYLNLISQIMGMGKKTVKDTQYTTDDAGNYYQVTTYSDGTRSINNLGKIGKTKATGNSNGSWLGSNTNPNQTI